MSLRPVGEPVQACSDTMRRSVRPLSASGPPARSGRAIRGSARRLLGGVLAGVGGDRGDGDDRSRVPRGVRLAPRYLPRGHHRDPRLRPVRPRRRGRLDGPAARHRVGPAQPGGPARPVLDGPLGLRLGRAGPHTPSCATGSGASPRRGRPSSSAARSMALSLFPVLGGTPVPWRWGPAPAHGQRRPARRLRRHRRRRRRACSTAVRAETDRPPGARGRAGGPGPTARQPRDRLRARRPRPADRRTTAPPRRAGRGRRRRPRARPRRPRPRDVGRPARRGRSDGAGQSRRGRARHRSRGRVRHGR